MDDDEVESNTMYYDKSLAYARLCERLHGRNLLQMGMGSFDELDLLIENMNFQQCDKVLDLGSGFGRVTEFLCDATGADFTGIDNFEQDVAIAKRLDRSNLRFSNADMTRLPFEAESFDKIISLDSLYFVDNLYATLDGILKLLKPNGLLGIFWSQPPRISMVNISPECTEVGMWANSRNLSYKAIDRIEEHKAFWKKSKQLFIDMEDDFKAEGMGEYWQRHIDEQQQVVALITAGKFPRWLFFINN